MLIINQHRKINYKLSIIKTTVVNINFFCCFAKIAVSKKQCILSQLFLGAVNAADVTAIYDVLLGVDNSLESSADVNSDDAVTSADVTDVYNVILGTYVPPVKRGKIYISCLLPRCQGLSSASEKVSTSIQ